MKSEFRLCQTRAWRAWALDYRSNSQVENQFSQDFFIPNLHIEASWMLFCISVSNFKPNSDKTLPPSGQTGNYNMSHRWESDVAFCGLICGFSRSFVLLFSVTEDSEEENTQSERRRHKWGRWRWQVGVSAAMSTLAARALCFLTRCFLLN